MIRLLVITNNNSLDQPSFRQRIAIYLDLLRNRGIGCEVARLPPSPLARRTLFASAQRFNGVLLHRKILNAWDGFWLRRQGATVIYDFDDAIMYNDRKPERASRIRFHRFGRTAALSRLVIAGNEYLAEHARRYNGQVEILPTGLDLGPYRAKPPRGDDGVVRLVWIGAGSGMLRHVHGIGPALEELGRRFPKVVLRLVCNKFFGLQAMRVEEQRWSRDTEVADLATSDIGLAPMADDPFTRGKCGFKILQYQAAGLPVVASPVGVNGEYVQDGVTGFLVRDPAQWVEKLSTLIENPELRTALGQAGQREVEKFDIRVIGERFSRLIAECLGHHNDGTTNQDRS
jgi:glycosyltransferase involved in cell wall biosynthesis